ncbi:hypothetical protein PPEV_gp020 [Pseudomonas phage EL]|uniref:SH3 fold domain-containing protein n=1 Tax=Pseudomonas phage EL TaxID=273133 RepID=Q2Z161_9CAUD|nr:phage DNA polymerase-associated SH3 family protein [Pseudomonas aeruginosa]YP_418053.1 hypothetical protein PPEV_gp020 [Pseudomonas phage EL]MBS9731030.1 hypothetical protein [Pseudomonas aeruginosa]MDH1421396.1 hypothetical protein [Pseudomonas aeruginosa]TQH45611.1 hypothetical protein FLI59_33430 [Pseudomonas aeruginosa]CAG27114.1 hypothetical protein [Pseudomonas phage EL]
MAVTPRLNDIVDFQLVRNGILGDERVGVLVISASMTYQAAKAMDPQINVKHSNLFQYFQNKVGGVDDPSKYPYFAVQLTNGQFEVIGVPWVNDATFKTIEGRIRTYTITNYQESMAGPIANMLRNLGASYTVHDTTTTKN